MMPSTEILVLPIFQLSQPSIVDLEKTIPFMFCSTTVYTYILPNLPIKITIMSQSMQPFSQVKNIKFPYRRKQFPRIISLVTTLPLIEVNQRICRKTNLLKV